MIYKRLIVEHYITFVIWTIAGARFLDPGLPITDDSPSIARFIFEQNSLGLSDRHGIKNFRLKIPLDLNIPDNKRMKVLRAILKTKYNMRLLRWRRLDEFNFIVRITPCKIIYHNDPFRIHFTLH